MTNTFSVAGNVGKDPEVRKSQDGKTITSFSVASKTVKDKTSWFNVTCFGKTAENVAQYVKKGSLVYVSGHVEIEKYEEKYYTKVIANSVGFLGGKKEESAYVNRHAMEHSGTAEDANLNADEIPF